MPTRPAQGGNTGTWGTDLNGWLDVGHNPDGTLKGAATTGGAPVPWTYGVLTDGVTMTVYSSAGAVVSTGTDLGALFNALVGPGQSWRFGPGDFPITTALSIPDETYISITLEGCGGLTNINIQNVTVQPGATRFKFTPSTGTLLDVSKAQGIVCKGIDFCATHASYTGSLVDFQGDYTTNPRKVTRHSLISECTFRTRLGDTTGALLEVSTCVDFTVKNCLFQGGRWCVRGIQSTGGLAIGEPSDEIHFHECRFQYYQNVYGAIANSYRSWSFNSCVFERATDGSKGNFLVNDVGIAGHGVAFNDCSAFDYADPNDLNGAFFTYNGEAFSVRNFFATFYAGIYLLALNDDTHGIHVSGVNNDSANTSTALILIQSAAASAVTDVVVQGNNLDATKPVISGTIAEPPNLNLPPYKALSADTTLTVDGHDRTFGVDSTSGAKTITLPAVACVGCTVTVKKIDASANAVTVQRAGSATIDGSTTYALAAQYKFVKLVSNGTNWMNVGSN